MTDVCQVVVAILVPLLSCGLSCLVAYFVSKRYGDVAGQKAAIEYDMQKAEQARIVAVQALLNEVTRIRSLASHNAVPSGPRLTVRSVTKMPVAAFEAAFLSGQSSLLGLSEDGSAMSDLVTCVADYLTRADAINTLVELYLGLVRGLSSVEERRRNDVLEKIGQKSKEMAAVLDQLENLLRRPPEARTELLRLRSVRP